MQAPGDLEHPRRKGGQAPVWILVVALVGEVIFYMPLLRGFLALAGTWSDVGSNFLGFWMLAIVPGAVVFGTSALLIYQNAVRSDPALRSRFLSALCIGNLILLIGSMGYYAARLHK
jgi:hypothetical protein